jgi:hypothetical protein
LHQGIGNDWSTSGTAIISIFPTRGSALTDVILNNGGVIVETEAYDEGEAASHGLKRSLDAQRCIVWPSR